MMIDFSTLSDDQLVELVRAACATAVSRGAAVEAATRAAMLSEAEKAQIAGAAAQREAQKLREEEATRIARDAADAVRREVEQKAKQEATDKQKRLWLKKKLHAQKCIEFFGAGTWLTVWEKNGEKRVYIETGEPFSKHGQKLVDFYCTGNSKHAPGSADFYHAAGDEQKADKLAFCKEVCAYWTGLKLNCDQAAAAEVA